jgi:hypothetical protein
MENYNGTRLASPGKTLGLCPQLPSIMGSFPLTYLSSFYCYLSLFFVPSTKACNSVLHQVFPARSWEPLYNLFLNFSCLLLPPLLRDSLFLYSLSLLLSSKRGGEQKKKLGTFPEPCTPTPTLVSVGSSRQGQAYLRLKRQLHIKEAENQGRLLMVSRAEPKRAR